MLGRNLLASPSHSWSVEREALFFNPNTPKFWRERLLSTEFPDLPKHVWVATSGSSGRTKVVAHDYAAIKASAAAVNRRLGVGPSDSWINPLPLFHVGGIGIAVRAALSKTLCHTFQEWNPQEFVRRATDCGATLSSLVPTQVHDLVRAQLRCPSNTRAIVVGGGALDESLRVRAAQLGWPLLPSYGMTETASQVATVQPGAEDFSWLPLLDHMEARVGDGGILELRGSSLLTGWMVFDADGSTRWEDPKRNGWFGTSDRVELRDGKLRFLGRADDLIKIRGELVDVVALETALQTRVLSGLVRLDPKPDARNGFELVVVVENASAEAEAREAAGLIPPYARPSKFRTGHIELNPLGKKIRPAR